MNNPSLKSVINGFSYDRDFLDPEFAGIFLSYLFIATFYCVRTTKADNSMLYKLSFACMVFAFVRMWTIVYEFFNDILACGDSLEYFTNGYTDIHRKLVKTDNKTTNAFAWGVYHATDLPG